MEHWRYLKWSSHSNAAPAGIMAKLPLSETKGSNKKNSRKQLRSELKRLKKPQNSIDFRSSAYQNPYSKGGVAIDFSVKALAVVLLLVNSFMLCAIAYMMIK